MHVPPELVDSIIDEVFFQSSSGTVDRPTVSALALVSHTFRHRTNSRRFSKISFMHKVEPLSRVHAFLALLTSDVWTADVGIARHIREFSLALGAVEGFTVVRPDVGAIRRKRLGPHPALTDGSMAGILNTIFRYPVPDPEHQIANTLVLSVWADSEYLSHLDFKQRRSWEDIVDPQFGFALQGLLDTYVSKLTITRVNDLPPTLLMASRIRELTLREARFRAPSASDYPMLGPMVHLQELKMDGDSVFTQGFDHLLPTLALPNVRHLQYAITPTGFYLPIPRPHPWKHLGALETLTLVATAKPLGLADLMQTAYSYSEHLRHLKKLIIVVDASVDDRPVRHRYSMGELTGNFIMVNLIVGLLPHLPWTNDLELSFRCPDFTQAYRNGVAAVFGDLMYDKVDQLLVAVLGIYRRGTFTARAPMITLTFNVFIHSALESFDTHEFCAAAYLYLEELFSLTYNGSGRKEFGNKVVKISGRDGNHSYIIAISFVCSI